MRRSLVWAVAVLLSVYLGLSGGGYDIVVRSEVGLVIWWFVLLGVLIGALPRARIPRAGWIATGLLAGFLIWTWIGLSWSSSHELTLDDVCRLSTYLGVFLFGLCVLTPETTRPLVNGLGCGIAIVAAAAVLSKLTPGLFPASAQGNSFYATGRLGYPFGYPDGVGEYAALGLPLVLYAATSARTLLGRALGTAALQPLLLCLAMTVSRGGILAAVVGIVAFVALVPERIPRLPTITVTAIGITALMLALLHRPDVRDSIAAAPAGERHSMLAILLVIVAAAAVAQALLVIVARRVQRPRWLHVSRRGAQAVAAALVLLMAIVVVVAITSGATGKLWHDFKLWNPPTNSNEYFRLFSVAGSHRYQYWQVAWKAFTNSPLHGIGSGTFQYYWNAHAGRFAEKIVNAHSLWFETLAETGIVGWLLLAGFFALITIGGAVRALRATGGERTLLATSTAGMAAFCAAASFDWIWQIGVVPIVAMLLAAVTLAAQHHPAGQPAASKPRASSALRRWLPPRLLLVPAAALAMLLIAIPLASTVALNASQKAVRGGHLRQALADAETAQAIEPGAASPYAQQALVLEQADDISGAAAAIKRAIAREPSNFQLWLLADPIATAQDRPREALFDYQRALTLFPNYPVLYLE
ncbi:MAG TPA: O-antigen ligase family protein [Solirubrobacteraceae bacterium]|nr:O-antigen ligase family protein [Solirubrobacteraceae bacterium]